MVLLPVKRVERLVKKAAKETFAHRKAAGEYRAMKKVFDQGPGWDARQIKHDPEQRVPAVQQQERHDERVSCVENRERIESPAGGGGMFAVISLARSIGGLCRG